MAQKLALRPHKYFPRPAITSRPTTPAYLTPKSGTHLQHAFARTKKPQLNFDSADVVPLDPRLIFNGILRLRHQIVALIHDSSCPEEEASIDFTS
ncbi:unnamed protein product [Sphagnum balticum]